MIGPLHIVWALLRILTKYAPGDVIPLDDPKGIKSDEHAELIEPRSILRLWSDVVRALSR